MRRMMGKTPITETDLLSKIDMLNKENIQLHTSFIFCGRGETPTSMRTPAQIAKLLAKYPNVTWILISPQLILPGSPDYRQLIEKPKMRQKWPKQDLINIAEINRDFLKYFAPELSREAILHEIKEIFAHVRSNTPKRRLVLDVKGVTAEEEQYIMPRRYYCNES